MSLHAGDQDMSRDTGDAELLDVFDVGDGQLGSMHGEKQDTYRYLSTPVSSLPSRPPRSFSHRLLPLLAHVLAA